MKAPDSFVVRDAIAGDHESFRLLVERYTTIVWRLAWRMTANLHDAEDVLQETFFFAWLHLRDFREWSDFGTWLRRIAINAAITQCRKREHHAHLQLAEELVSPELDPESSVWKSEIRVHVIHALKELNTRERMPFCLRYFEEMPAREIGRRLRIPGVTVRQRIHQAVKKLRHALEPIVRKHNDARNRRRDR